MSVTMMPFLYQTRTLLPLRLCRTFSHTARCRAWPDKSDARAQREDPGDEESANSKAKPSYAMPKLDKNLPFIGLEEVQPEPEPQHRESTMSPTEAETFRQIFDEITTGKMPQAKPLGARKGVAAGRADLDALDKQEKYLHEDAEKPKKLNFFQREAEKIQSNLRERSILEQARKLSDFKENILPSYPLELQDAAKAALNLYKEGERKEAGLERLVPSMEQRQHQAKVETLREQEKKRLDHLFSSCETDVALWDVLESEIFTLPPKLGLVMGDEEAQAGQKGAKKGKKKTAAAIKEQAFNMDVYGPLVSQCTTRALHLFDTAFAYPSLRSFHLLPRLKSLGLSAYVLAVSTSFYTRLARIHWDRHGDPVTALNLIQEMYSIGLTPNAETGTLLIEMQDELDRCAKGQQGLFVASMMDSPPYDGDLMNRLAKMEDEVRHALHEQGLPVQ